MMHSANRLGASAFLMLGLGAWASDRNGASNTQGSPVNTGASAAVLRSTTGADLRFSQNSSGTLFADHVELTAGALRAENLPAFAIEAGGIEIRSANAQSIAAVRVGENAVEIAALRGPLEVTDARAAIIPVAAGAHISLQAAAATSAQTTSSRYRPRNRHVMWWVIGGIAAAAIGIGIAAGVQGKSL